MQKQQVIFDIETSGLTGLRGQGPLFQVEWISFIEPQTSQSEHLRVNTRNKNSFIHTRLGVGVASKHSDSTICFGQGSTSNVTNKANGWQSPCAEISTVFAKRAEELACQ